MDHSLHALTDGPASIADLIIFRSLGLIERGACTNGGEDLRSRWSHVEEKARAIWPPSITHFDIYTGGRMIKLFRIFIVI